MSYAGQVRINGTDYPVAATLYGTCNTAAATATKAVTLADFDTLIVGAMVAVNFMYGNTAANPKLNVNGTGALPIYLDGTDPAVGAYDGSWSNNSIRLFVYDGTSWKMLSEQYALDAKLAVLESDVNDAFDAVTAVFAPAYSASATYQTGALCFYNGHRYKCTTAITSAEAFNSAHWTVTTVAAETRPRQGSISMPTASWSGSGPWTQTVTVSGATVYQKSAVDLQPDATVYGHMASVGCAAIFVTNNNGTLTATAIQKKPTSNLTVQCTVKEIS